MLLFKREDRSTRPSWAKIVLRCAVVVATLSLANYAQAQSLERLALWAGSSVNSNLEEDFTQVELAALFDLPWRKTWPSGWSLDIKLSATVGMLRAANDTGYLATVGPGALLAKDAAPYEILAGFSPTLLTDHEYGNDDLGGNVHFTSYVAFHYSLNRRLWLGGRLQHTSNGGLDDKNPGIDLVAVEIQYRIGE